MDLPTLEQAEALVRHRRTIKPADMDADRPVDRALLERLLDAARWAPNHGLTEPWRFVVYEGAAREVLAKKLQALYESEMPANEFRPEKHAKLGSTPLMAPTVVMIGMARDPKGKIPEIEEVEAVACAVQNMHLCASAAGLGAKWSSPPICYSPEMARWLGFDQGDKCLGIFYLGWPKAGSLWPEGRRQTMAGRVRHENL